MKAITITIAAASLIFYFLLCGSQKKPLKSMLLNSLSGLAALIAAAVVSGGMGCGIAVNYATVLIATALGVPGVIGLVLIMFVL